MPELKPCRRCHRDARVIHLGSGDYYGCATCSEMLSDPDQWNRLADRPASQVQQFIDLVKPIVAKLDDRAAVTCKASQLRELIAELEADNDER